MTTFSSTSKNVCPRDPEMVDGVKCCSTSQNSLLFPKIIYPNSFDCLLG
jgi:hypothetical protein